MLRGLSTLRLTRRELTRWTKLTGFTPADVRSEEDLARFASRCKRHFWGCSEDTRFLHFLIDEELRRNLSDVGPTWSATGCPMLDTKDQGDR